MGGRPCVEPPAPVETMDINWSNKGESSATLTPLLPSQLEGSSTGVQGARLTGPATAWSGLVKEALKTFLLAVEDGQSLGSRGLKRP